ncbi:MAG: hypothetical protein AAGA10_05475 [Bacteroidota bacterium]
MRIFVGLVGIFFSCTCIQAQNADILLGHDLYHYVDRLDIQGLSGDFFPTTLKPYGRQVVADFFATVDTQRLSPVENQWHKRMRILVDDAYASSTSQKGIWNTFYTNGRDLYHVDKEPNKFRLYVNPSFHLALGNEQETFLSTERQGHTLLNNIRGLSIRGVLWDKIGFYTEVTDNVIRVPQEIFQNFEENDQLYDQTFVKRFGNTENGLDFFNARAYLTFRPIEAMRIKVGKDRAFWGLGRQSLFLNDHAADYAFVNIQTKIWKLVYVNHFTQLLDFVPNKGDTEGTWPRKYGVFHQLSYFPTNTISLSLFESIIYNPYLANGKRGFEIQYLNPLIFFRAIEQSLGSPDNATIGFSAKVNAWNRFQLYGQFLIDDLNIGQRDNGDDYWGNKLGYQVGAKYINAFSIPTLDLQVEYNRVRPYTYQHFNIAANYSQFDQSLGHAAGANLYDLYVGLRYHPLPPLNIELAYTTLTQGLDMDGINYGGDINRSYSVDRAGDFGQIVGQGDPLNMDQIYGRLTYQLWNTDIYAEIEGRYRTENERESASILGGVRMGLPQRIVKF